MPLLQHRLFVSSGGSSGGSSYTPPRVDYEALRRQREAEAAARAERERLRQERIAREAEERAQKERNKAAAGKHRLPIL